MSPAEPDPVVVNARVPAPARLTFTGLAMLPMPLAVRVAAPVVTTCPVFPLISPGNVMLPALLTLTAPAPAWLTAVILRLGAVLVRVTPPLDVFVALKAATVLAPFSVRPPTDDVVNVPAVFTKPVPDSAIAL